MYTSVGGYIVGLHIKYPIDIHKRNVLGMINNGSDLKQQHESQFADVRIKVREAATRTRYAAINKMAADYN